MKLLAVALAIAGCAGCDDPAERADRYVIRRVRGCEYVMDSYFLAPLIHAGDCDNHRKPRGGGLDTTAWYPIVEAP